MFFYCFTRCFYIFIYSRVRYIIITWLLYFIIDDTMLVSHCCICVVIIRRGLHFVAVCKRKIISSFARISGAKNYFRKQLNLWNKGVIFNCVSNYVRSNWSIVLTLLTVTLKTLDVRSTRSLWLVFFNYD